MKYLKSLGLCSFLILLGLALVGCGRNNNDEDKADNGNGSDEEQLYTGTYELNKTFAFSGLEITLIDDITWTTIPNSNAVSELRGRTVAVIPITIKNTSTRVNRLNSQHVEIFSPNEEELEPVGWVFNVDISESIEPNETLITHLHVLYDGDGEYIVLFQNFSTTRILIPFEITR